MRGGNMSETFKVNFCPKCKIPFERFWTVGKNRHQLYYYDNIPSYGLKRKICPDCDGSISSYRKKDIRGLNERSSIKKIYKRMF